MIAKKLPRFEFSWTLRFPLCFLVNEKVQKQLGASGCGLFALAFAADLCHGLDPTNRSCDQAKMREHYIGLRYSAKRNETKRNKTKQDEKEFITHVRVNVN